MKITVGYDYAAWPVGGYTAYDESTYDGDPESNAPMGYGRTVDDAIEELAAQCLSKPPYEDITVEQLNEAERNVEWNDDHTRRFITHLREYVS